MNSSDRPKCSISAKTRWCAIACATAILASAMTRPALAGCSCGKWWPHMLCHQHGPSHATGPGDIINADTGGNWYWVRSPEQEKRVAMNLYNRYCIRCHGVNGRGVWDIPDVPDFTHPVWQATRSDDYRSRVILEGRGAVMPAFRGIPDPGGIVGPGPLSPHVRPGHGGLATRSPNIRRRPPCCQSGSHGAGRAAAG